MKTGDKVFLINTTKKIYKRFIIEDEYKDFIYICNIPFEKETGRCSLLPDIYVSKDKPNMVDFKQST